MRNIFYLCIFIVLIIFSNSISNAQVPARKGWWKFNDKSNILKADIGTDLSLNGSLSVTDGPTTNDYAVTIGVGSYLKMTHGIAPNLGNYVNEYTLSIDFKVSSIGRWYCFFQTSPTNANDGDCFINTSGNIGVGAVGYSSYALRANEWYKLVISVKNGSQYKLYLDGQLLLNGTTQTVDGRFSLDKTLLMFADNDGEDADITCSEISVWDSALSEANISSLGSFGHILAIPKTQQLMLVPFLQNPGTTSMFISWHDTSSVITKIEYGTTSNLGFTATGSSEIVSEPYRWHTVKLTGLKPNQEYFYKVVSGSGSSPVYNFRTMPDASYKGKIRFLLLSDTHNSDTTMAVKVIKEARKKIQQLYGNDFHNQVNVVLISGDLVVSGNTITQWTDQFFAPMANVSPYIPFLTVTGNHEGESANYYKYMQLDDISGYPPPNSFTEKFWASVIGNTMFVGLNTNLTGAAQSMQNLWLDNKLAEAENNSQIDFVFVIGHHMEVSEIWGEGMSDAGSLYIRTQIFPILKKYSKVIQYSFGHTHAFERGTIESESLNPRTDFRTVCGGGGGGATDRWNVYVNFNYPSVQISLDNYFYQIGEIDIASKTFESTMYSLGNASKVRNNEVMDKWYIKLNQPAPAKPVSATPTFTDTKIIFNTSSISGDSLMTTRIQIGEDQTFTKAAVDTLVHWKDIYKVDAAFNPVDLNKGLDLTKLSFNKSRFKGSTTYYYRVKYRDHNLKWSEWSNSTSFNTPTSLANEEIPTKYSLEQNFPNPFNPITKINYRIAKAGIVTIKLYDLLGKEVDVIENTFRDAGKYSILLDASQLSSGVYFYKMVSGNFSSIKKLILMK